MNQTADDTAIFNNVVSLPRELEFITMTFGSGMSEWDDLNQATLAERHLVR